MQNSRKLKLKLQLTRRLFIGEIAAAGVALSALPLSMGGMLANDQGTRLTKAPSAGIVSIHMDQPYWDASGAGIPYLPPCGMRAAAPIAHLSEQAFRGMHCYV